jgi:hypothetical protein
MMEPTTGESLTRLAEIAAAVSRVNQQQVAPGFPGFAGSRLNETAPHPMLQVTAAAFAAANHKRRSSSSITPSAAEILKAKGEADLPVALPPRKKIKRADESEDVRFREYQGKRTAMSVVSLFKTFLHPSMLTLCSLSTSFSFAYIHSRDLD